MFSNKRLNAEEAFRLLTARRLPGRLSTSEAAVLLGFQEHDIPVLVIAKLIEPLGRPAANATKYFSANDVVDRANNREWLAKATRMISSHWRSKNECRNLTFKPKPLSHHDGPDHTAT